MKSGTQKLKKFLAFVMTAVMVLTAVPLGGVTFSASAENEEYTEGYYTYTVKNGEATITYCDEGISGDVVIPDTLGGYPVTSIGDDAFYDCTGLTSITIPDSVTSIGVEAFSHCTGLTSITIPDGVTSIGWYAFALCESLTSITIPDSVTSIGLAAFYNCSGLTSITIPDSVTSIGASAFSGCTGLTSITIPNSVTSIGGGAFDDTAYYNNDSNWENDVLYIGNHLIKAKEYFSGDYDIKNGTKTIADNAFYGRTGLTSITIPDSVTSIGEYAFAWCESLTSITIPDSVTSIGDDAFIGCTGLTSITIPDSVTSIGYEAFYGCTGLTSITVSTGNTVYHSTDNCLIETESKTLILGCNNSIIPADGSVTSIGYAAFEDCTCLTRVTIPDGVTNIGSRAFSGCTGLASITIPDSVTSIGFHAFSGCTGLTSVTIGNGVTSIDIEAFYGCTGLTSITLPDSVTSIGGKAFSGCTGLTSITIPDSVTSIGWDAFYDTAYYNNNSNWEDDVLYIGNHFIKAKDSISGAYDVKNGTKTIAEDAFGGCTGLASITIPDSVTSIGGGTFSDCAGLTSITIPDSVTSIGDNAFNNTAWYNAKPDGDVYAGKVYYKYKGNMPENTSVSIKDGTKGVADDAFYGCTGLTSVSIGNSVTSIGEHAFFRCTGLTSVSIGNSVTSIGEEAFAHCTGLESITIPASVTDIGHRAFGGYYSDGEYGKLDNFTIYGRPGTAAETYANENGFAFIALDEEHTHTYSAWVVITEATCTEDGAKHKVCSVCNDEVTETITKLGHDWAEDFTVDKEATCTEKGSKSKHCSRCSEKSEVTEIPAKGHSYGEWIVDTEATCTAEGEETRTCSVCGASETRSVVRKAHTFGDWVTTKQATVFESGERKRTCTGCGKVSETNPINKVSSIKLSKTSFTYNGKVQKPTVTVKDSKGTALKNGRDYTVKYSSGRKDVGTYYVTVTMKGNYSGSKKLSFSILPQGTSIKSLSASSAGFTAKWKKKTNQITGYQLQYSTSNSFKSVKTITIKKNSDTSRSVSNLKGRTKYYVRVRTYKKVGNKNYYSSWSSAKTVATKPVTGVEILSSATIYVGGSKTLSAKTYPTKVTVKWKSSNTSVAKVSSNGKVTAIKKGKATITAYFAYGGKTYKANCAVTVKSRNPKIK